MKFGFIAHTASKDEINMLRIIEQLRSSPLSDFLNGNSVSVNNDLECDIKTSVDFVESIKITSSAGAECTGKITYLPILPEEITSSQDAALERIIKAAKDLEKWGADIIGLGGYTAVVGGRGKEVQKALNTATVTTGNSYTTYTSIETMEYIINRLGLKLNEIQTAVIGFPGSISLAITKILAVQGAKITVVGRRNNLTIKNFLAELEPQAQENVSVTLQLKEALENADLVFAATSTGSVIDLDWMKPGAIVIDIGEPKDVIKRENDRDDVLVLDGGRFNIDESVNIDSPLGALFKTGFYGCVGETVLLALEQLKENLSLGRVLGIEKIEQIGSIAKKHGFKVTELHSWGSPVDDTVLERIRKIIYKNNNSTSVRLNTFDSVMKDTKEAVWERYKNHMNPVLAAISEAGDYDRTFVKAKGINLWDTDGRMYYDFVGGYGSVNLGHNHPRIIEAVRKFVDFGAPSLLQVSPGLFSSALAENLAKVTPGNLEFTFFCNSGAEAVEGALKLARIHTGRHKYVSTINSFHGKTYGSLSVTGREKYQKYFQPLLHETTFVPFGDINSLEEALATGDVAAFIVEPIQGEGGVIVPPQGYLKKAEELCRQYGTLLIIDEIQTGFGRTGKLFAVEYEGVVPDILTVAKSLSGGLIPIGAYITTKEIWEKAYGNQNRYLLHTSTFGGNNFCTSVGLMALEVILTESLEKNALEVGQYLRSGLEKLTEKYNFMKGVRGRGLMIGIEFYQPMDGGLERMKQMLTSMVPNQLKSKLLTLPEGLINKFNDFVAECQVEIEKNLEDNFTSQIATKLLNKFGVLTIVTLNNPNVMRIQPPLTIKKEEADYFIQALDVVCSEISVLDKGDLEK
ncbi:MAG: aminotransferase class III-fold pyridoxal phosphate-dependent enzyme [Clostridia bacterium]|nr:aminotransferase class III-fold pyridoxal phosphate-dependent enzyme [Clostridia bacterium]